MRKVFIFIMLLVVNMGCSQEKKPSVMNQNDEIKKVEKTEQEWKKQLSGDEFYVLRQKGTERAFTGKFDKFYEEGRYYCAGCGNYLFHSDTKYSSGCGWPSFFDVQSKESLKLTEDNSLGMKRIEITCASCDGHLGHVFPDGPEPTGTRYCVNSVSLKFVPDSSSKKDTAK